MPERASRDEIIRWWDEGWSIALGSIEALTPEDLDRTITIRGEGFLVIEALNRSVAHAASHVGQIVYLARHFAGDAWTSLTIPKGASANDQGRVQKIGSAPRPRAGAGGSVPPSARIFMFSSACVNCAVRRVLSASRAALSASIELSKNSV